MSLLHKADAYEKPIRDADRKHPDYALVLALVCLALTLLVVAVRFTPVQPGSEIISEMLIGP